VALTPASDTQSLEADAGGEAGVAGERILVADDEEDVLELVAYHLTRDGYRVEGVATGEEALRKAKQEAPDLLVLDLMLPGMDGLEVCRLLKRDERSAGIPIVMLTARGEEADIVAGLELGADDYVTKPFSPRVLVARIRAVLRRRARQVPTEGESLRVGELVIHPARREVLVQDEPVELTFTEFGILHLLARRPGWVFTRYQIVDGARGADAMVTDRSVDVHIVSLRRKLGPVADCLETVRGVGYRLRDT
jgi:two-component system phosphate regulon response regulator PhoB